MDAPTFELNEGRRAVGPERETLASELTALFVEVGLRVVVVKG